MYGKVHIRAEQLSPTSWKTMCGRELGSRKTTVYRSKATCSNCLQAAERVSAGVLRVLADAGASYTELSNMAGVTPQRVHQLVKRERERNAV